jgi:transcriptional regulator with XRE-family HTH domain
MTGPPAERLKQHIKGLAHKGVALARRYRRLQASPSGDGMLASRFGPLLRSARTHRCLSRAQLAERGGVSVRLVAELEQGKRPNVSLESALKLLRAAGVTVVARAPHGGVVEIRDPSAAAVERGERSAQRRKTWTGRQVHLHASGDEPLPERSTSKRLASVGRVSRQAYSIAATGQRLATGDSKGPSGQ